MLAAAQATIDLQPGFVSLGLRAVALGAEDTAIVAGEDDQRVLRLAGFIKRVQDAADAAVQFMNPVAIRSGLAAASQILVRRDGIVHRHRRVVEEERFVLWLLGNPLARLLRELRHDPFIHAAWRIDLQDGGFGILHVFGAIRRFEVRVIRIRAGQLHASGNLAAAQAIDESVLHIHASEIAVIRGHTEVIIKADVQRPGRQLGRVVGAPLGVVGGGAVAQVPLADSRRLIAVLLQQRRHVQPRGLDVQRREGAEHFMRQRGAPAVAPGQHRVARGRAHGTRRVRIREATTFLGESVEVGRLDQLAIGTVGPGAAVAKVIAEDHDDVGRGGEERRAQGKKTE